MASFFIFQEENDFWHYQELGKKIEMTSPFLSFHW
jgi:hypothetical protein